MNANTTTTTTTNASGYTDAEMAAMLKDYQRDCRLGHCGHHSCRRKADQRVAAANRVETVCEPEVAFDPGFDVGATYKDYLRDQRVNRLVRSTSKPRRSRRSRTTTVQPVRYVMTADGRIDKRATRMERLFGSPTLWN